MRADAAGNLPTPCLPPPHHPSPSPTPFTPSLAYLGTKGAEGHGGLDEMPSGTTADGHHEASCGRARGGEQDQDSGKTHLMLGCGVDETVTKQATTM